MTNLELVLNMLAEATTKEISKEKKPKTFTENRVIAKQGGTIAGNTRKEIEEKTGKKVTSSMNAKKLGKRDNDEIKSIEKQTTKCQSSRRLRQNQLTECASHPF
jgi:L-asparaginase/Glu-tRNA(Gln) amidotransferase subunit D